MNANAKLDVTILCKVVDNFGDIGVVYRLSRALNELYAGEVSPSGKSTCNALRFALPPLAGSTPQRPQLNLRIITDDVHAFSLLAPELNSSAQKQQYNGWQIFDWNAFDLCFSEFSKNPPKIIIECFQCGRPEWLEHLLFDVTVPETVHIIMLDYLTAEPYAETFHKLKSLTRSARVQKVNFMPGFTAKTGGLILDQAFLAALTQNKKPVTAVFFSYPMNHTPIIASLAKFNQAICNGALNVHLAQGAGFNSFKTAYNSASTNKETLFSLTELPFLPQLDWDSLLCRSSLLFIRGEDSLSRACLCGVPFVWHAYPQSEEYQLVKVAALLDRMKPHFLPDLYELLERCWTLYNTTSPDSTELQTALTNFLLAYDRMKPCFKSFAKSLLKNGNLAEHLLEFAKERVAEF